MDTEGGRWYPRLNYLWDSLHCGQAPFVSAAAEL